MHELPVELWVAVFRNLDAEEDILSCWRACRTWHLMISKNPLIWKRFFCHEISNDALFGCLYGRTLCKRFNIQPRTGSLLHLVCVENIFNRLPVTDQCRCCKSHRIMTIYFSFNANTGIRIKQQLECNGLISVTTYRYPRQKLDVLVAYEPKVDLQVSRCFSMAVQEFIDRSAPRNRAGLYQKPRQTQEETEAERTIKQHHNRAQHTDNTHRE